MSKMNLLLQVSSQLAHERDLKNILIKLADIAKNLLNADRCSIFLHDKEKKELWTMVAHGVKEIRVPDHVGVVGYVFKTGETLNITDPYSDCRFDPKVDKATGYLTKNILAVALQDKAGGILGVFQVINKLDDLSYSEEDIELLKHLALYASSTLENVFLNEQLKLSHEEIARWNKVLEQKVIERTEAISNLLNNAGQGFLSFGGNLVIGEEYSLECQKIFGFDIAKKKFPEIIAPNDEVQREFLETIFPKILEDEDMEDLYFPLLPDEIRLEEKYIHLDYKLINRQDGTKMFMAILSDITEKRFLEMEMLKEKNILKLVLKFINQHNDFMEMINEYREFCFMGLNNILAEEDSLVEVAKEVFRQIHNFKGNFAQLEMEHLAKRLHDVENELHNFTANISNYGMDDLRNLLGQFDLASWLQESLAVLEELLDERFFEQNTKVTVDIEKIRELEERVVCTCSAEECQILLPEIKELRYRSFKELLNSYPENMEILAGKLDKPIYPLLIQGEDVLVDIRKYQDFTKSLVHVFRNMLDHGLETLDERIEKNKDPYGQIQCFVEPVDNQICLRMSDDGKGISIDKIRKKAVENGMFTWEEIFSFPKERIIPLIFEDGFSTKEEVTQLSGRGVGMAIVKKELEKIQGRLEIKSEEGLGTEFSFWLPLEDKPDSTVVSLPTVMDTFVEKTKELLVANFALKEKGISSPQSREKLYLQDFTAFVGLKGIWQANIAISVDESLGKAIVGKMVLGSIDSEQERSLLEPCLAELCNTIAGSSLKNIPYFEDNVMVESPELTIFAEKAVLSYMQREIWQSELEFEEGKLVFSLIVE